MIEGAVRKEGVEADAGPFELIEWREKSDALMEKFGIGKEGDRFFKEERCETFREDAVGLIGEVDEGFGRVIPPSVFKINITETAVRLPESVMKTEIRWGEATFGNRQYELPICGRFFFDMRLDRFPERS